MAAAKNPAGGRAAAAAEKSLSLAEKGAAEEDDIRRHLLRPLLEHTFNLFFVVILAGYLFLMFASLKYLDIWFAAAAITFMSPYFLMMLHAVLFLKDVYIEQYAVPN